MGKHSKAHKTCTSNLLLNLSNIGSKTKRAWEELSPKKLQKWLSPRKKHKENVSPSAAPAARNFTWKLPKPTVEEVDDDQLSTYTFPPPAEPYSFPGPLPPSSPPPHSSQDYNNCTDDPQDLIDVPEADDELLATSPSHDDDYPRPCASCSFLDHMHEQAMHPGALRQAPNLGEAKVALECMQRYLRGELRGTDLWGLRGVGYKDPDISAFRQNRLTGIRTLLNIYVTPGLQGGTYGR
ncbi:hypothetical protein C8R43DRAFT_946029 [Mycena crocata]|nr:hypothetical protein C8R43DRAFT_946029 [Mycena crocata]